MRRKRLYIRQSLAYREGKSSDARWHIGFWIKKVIADEAFLSLGGYETEVLAREAARAIAKKQRNTYIYGINR